MSVTVTFHLWWLGAYLGVGALLYVPLNWLAWRTLARPRDSFAVTMRRVSRPMPVLVQVAAWPLALWEWPR